MHENKLKLIIVNKMQKKRKRNAKICMQKTGGADNNKGGVKQQAEKIKQKKGKLGFG
jgi:hypothetical protein